MYKLLLVEIIQHPRLSSALLFTFLQCIAVVCVVRSSAYLCSAPRIEMKTSNFFERGDMEVLHSYFIVQNLITWPQESPRNVTSYFLLKPFVVLLVEGKSGCQGVLLLKGKTEKMATCRELDSAIASNSQNFYSGLLTSQFSALSFLPHLHLVLGIFFRKLKSKNVTHFHCQIKYWLVQNGIGSRVVVTILKIKNLRPWFGCVLFDGVRKRLTSPF